MATCYFCDNETPEGYPNSVCDECDQRAKTTDGDHQGAQRQVDPPDRTSEKGDGTLVVDSPPDTGENPVLIDGVQCWRRYRFGGWVTMADPEPG